ncbi:hypothetical protein Tco_0173075 [Tanacetum coccineum]
MQGTSLTKLERECKLYDEFDKFAYKKGETLLNTKFLNTLRPEWSKFVTDVKLVRDLHTTNIDQLHAYLGQHEFHANEEQVEAILGNKGLLFVTTIKGKDTCPNSALNQRGKRDDSWFKDKVLLVQAQASAQILHEEELAFLANPGILEGQSLSQQQTRKRVVKRSMVYRK